MSSTKIVSSAIFSEFNYCVIESALIEIIDDESDAFSVKILQETLAPYNLEAKIVKINGEVIYCKEFMCDTIKNLDQYILIKMIDQEMMKLDSAIHAVEALASFSGEYTEVDTFQIIEENILPNVDVTIMMLDVSYM